MVTVTSNNISMVIKMNVYFLLIKILLWAFECLSMVHVFSVGIHNLDCFTLSVLSWGLLADHLQGPLAGPSHAVLTYFKRLQVLSGVETERNQKLVLWEIVMLCKSGPDLGLSQLILWSIQIRNRSKWNGFLELWERECF